MAACVIFLKSLLTRSDVNGTLPAEVYSGIKWLPNEEELYWQVIANETCGLPRENQDDLKILMADITGILPDRVRKKLLRVCTCTTSGRVMYFLTGSKMRIAGTAVAVVLAYLAVKYVVRRGEKIRIEEREMYEAKLAQLKRQLGHNLIQEVEELKGTLVHTEDLKEAGAGLAKQKDLVKLEDRIDTIGSAIEEGQAQDGLQKDKQVQNSAAVEVEEEQAPDLKEDVTSEFDCDSNKSISSEWIELDEELLKGTN
ncbi:uncharacterized protein BDZ99DRAFT_548475 [Mytilinidion resinicola]|uniref:Uncharacterized protein n=1 Tax=Mytilinidion resinicola TaxID=574789 RepID=A0A6A6Z142_9PEZI|nr:uncharacterized protein BDZ99DRAFT_548475 [Mytilinidion resinicola]KAF2814518.1 hypothetical protein BDZ99DRAFT_548475 [Mytilinidion resinicola]